MRVLFLSCPNHGLQAKIVWTGVEVVAVEPCGRIDVESSRAAGQIVRCGLDLEAQIAEVLADPP